MNGDEKPAEVAKLLDEIAAAVPQLSEEEHFNQLRELHNRLEQKLKEGRQSTTLADLNDQLSSIDEHLAHVNDNTSELKHIGSILIEIQKNTKATMESVKAVNGNMVFITMVAVFWSVFVWWKTFDNVQAFFHAIASRLFHPFS
jgi:cell division septum initiation protein DivIVA